MNRLALRRPYDLLSLTRKEKNKFVTFRRPMHAGLQAFLDALPEWNDLQKRNALLSSIKGNKEDILIHNRPKIDFWVNAIFVGIAKDLLHQESILSCNAAKLSAEFSVDGAAPLCLSVILEHLQQTGRLVPIDLYLNDKRKSLGDHAFGVVKNALRLPVLSAAKLYSFLIDQENEDDDDDTIKGTPIAPKIYLVPEYVDKICNTLIQTFADRHHDFIDHCISAQELETYILEVCKTLDFGIPSIFDITIIVKRLANLTHPSVVIEAGINFSNPLIFTGCKSFRLGKNELSMTVRSVIHLKSSMRSTELQMRNLDKKIAELDESVKSYLFKMKNKAMALEIMKRRKFVEAQQLKLQTSLANMEQILESIRMAKTNEDVLGAYKEGTAALKVLVSSSEALSATETMDNLLESLDQAKALDETIAVANQLVDSAAVNISEDEELEAELATLLAEKAPKPLVEAPRPPEPADQLTELLESLNVGTSPLPVVKEEGSAVKERREEEPEHAV